MSIVNQLVKPEAPERWVSHFSNVAVISAKLTPAFLLMCVIFIGLESGIVAAAESEETPLK
ncbi:MAG: hypothetical protein K8F25_19455, partial [Fimbriimonadaceae bacterium]|nr:hypothetical protein [Alphaproteobacteria bacterium]